MASSAGAGLRRAAVSVTTTAGIPAAALYEKMAPLVGPEFVT